MQEYLKLELKHERQLIFILPLYLKNLDLKLKATKRTEEYRRTRSSRHPVFTKLKSWLKSSQKIAPREIPQALSSLLQNSGPNPAMQCQRISWANSAGSFFIHLYIALLRLFQRIFYFQLPQNLRSFLLLYFSCFGFYFLEAWIKRENQFRVKNVYVYSLEYYKGWKWEVMSHGDHIACPLSHIVPQTIFVSSKTEMGNASNHYSCWETWSTINSESVRFEFFSPFDG